MHKAYQFRIYPSQEQQNFLSNHFGSVRYIYNTFLSKRKDEYLNNKKNFSYNDDCKFLTSLKAKDGYDWLYDINSQTLQASLRDLDVAYSRFFRKESFFPRFKSKKNRQSFKIPQYFSIEQNKLYIPKLKTGIKINLHRNIPEGKFISCFISKTSTNKYYASILIDENIVVLDKIENKIGIDLGLKNIIISSNEEKINNPKFYKKIESKLKFNQRQLSKKKKGSNNRNKQKIKVARIHEKILNNRKNFNHKLTKKLINENQIIVAESLSVKNMIKNHKLAKSIQDASWGEIIRQLKYKAEWYGRTFIQIDRWFPSSKTCNNCQFVVDDLPLNVREWICPCCNVNLDRDINAAKNILDKGLKDL